MGTFRLHPLRGARAFLRRALSIPASALAVTVAAVVPVACGDANGLTTPPSIENVTRVYSVFALTGSPAELPAAYQFTTETLARPQIFSNGTINFDVAFDIGADGRVRLLPARVLVPLPPAGAPSVGLLRVGQTYLALQRAPDRGYQVDTIATLGVGETIALELRNSACIYGEPYYGKLTVDSILVAERRIVARSLVNRNCGSRALTEGVPSN
jgi:hypothetical protein